VAPSLYDYGVIGNLRTAALVSRFGSVDWACFPGFSSPSIFSRLLAWGSGGGFAVAPRAAYHSEQSYLPSSNILLTRFFLRGNRQLDLVDLMPVVEGGSSPALGMIVRIAEARGGPIPVEVRVEPRFRYGSEPARWTAADGGFVARGTADQLVVRSSLPVAVDGARLGGTTELSPGAPATVELSWGSDRPTPLPAEELLRATTRFWQGWVHRPTTPLHRIAGLWHSWVERSELVLKLLSSQASGAFVAAPTTSLPEWIGGGRNWDYRYVWIRDAAFAAQALLLLGHLTEAERFLGWIVARQATQPPGVPLRVVYGVDGETDLGEQELPHLAGYRGSRPVRVGNAAQEQFQLDIYGELLDGARLLAVRRPEAVAPHWPDLARIADEVTRLWTHPDRGIWEIRGPPRHYVHSKLMAWVALDRAIDLAHRFGDRSTAERLEPTRAAIRSWILEHGFDASSGAFLQAAGGREVDAANLRIPLVGFLPFEDPRVLGTVRRIQRELGSGPFLYRYRAPDALDGPEGTFLPAAFWLVECLARIGRRREATARWRRLLLAASPLGLFPEEYDPRHRRPLGNFPQAFTHIGVLRAAVALGDSETPSFLEPLLLRAGAPEGAGPAGSARP